MGLKDFHLSIYPFKIAGFLGRLVARLAIAVVILGVLVGGRLILRDMFISMYSHRQAGAPVSFDAGYRFGAANDPSLTWGITMNSDWMVDRIPKIVPYLETENLRQNAVYPFMAVFIPYRGARSFVVGGSADCKFLRLFLNERYASGDPSWNDERRALSTLTHELIHIQAGSFCLGDPGMSGAEWSYFVEGNTEAATLEVLAAMCGWAEKDSVECGAFWSVLEGLARRSVFVRLSRLGLKPIYDLWSNIYLRTDDERHYAARSDVFWTGNEGERLMIADKYALQPWENIVLPGIRGGHVLNTRNPHFFDKGYVILGMPFDDTRLQMGWLVILAWVR